VEELLLIWNAERRKRSGVFNEKIECGGFRIKPDSTNRRKYRTNGNTIIFRVEFRLKNECKMWRLQRMKRS